MRTKDTYVEIKADWRSSEAVVLDCLPSELTVLGMYVAANLCMMNDLLKEICVNAH